MITVFIFGIVLVGFLGVLDHVRKIRRMQIEAMDDSDCGCDHGDEDCN